MKQLKQKYEIMLIVDSRGSDEEAGALVAQLGEHLQTLGAEVAKVDNWGKRRLAYDIRKQREGLYAVLDVTAEPATVKEFQRQLRLNENVLRFLSTRVPVRRRPRTAPTDEPSPPPPPPAPQGERVLEEVG